ncbi:unnamed protein product [Rhizoctonia solani]|uniref:Uncharacterized protein n=1 Tax=Rhizoctonia solani TaxID=456999 RepID=A0A8H3BAH7_9AGAM|nr:unnamed protein product [Rhizoctonia solani]
MASSSSLNNVVNSLVRASMGASVSTTVTDEDLDRHVAELILKEAKTKAEKYDKEGIRAYLPQPGYGDSSVPKTNKRFLSSLVKNVNDHNKVVLQAQADAAEQVKETRRQEEMKDRRRRAEEATDDRIRVQRLFSQGLRSSGDSWRDRDRRRNEGRSERRSRSPRGKDRDSRRSPSPRRRSRSRSPRRSRSPSRKHKSSRDERRSERKHRKRERSLSPEDSRSSKRRSDHKQEPGRSKRDSGVDLKRNCQEKGKDRGDDDNRLKDGSLTPEPVGLIPASSSSKRSTRSPSPGYGPDSATYSSKMDKYFSEAYDPRLDVQQPSISTSGLLEGPQWEGWEGMLEVMRLRAQDKEEKKRRDREDREKDKFDRKRAKEKGFSALSSSTIPNSTGEAGLMDIKYKKRGAVKEWDLAKETPT